MTCIASDHELSPVGRCKATCMTLTSRLSGALSGRPCSANIAAHLLPTMIPGTGTTRRKRSRSLTRSGHIRWRCPASPHSSCQLYRLVTRTLITRRQGEIVGIAIEQRQGMGGAIGRIRCQGRGRGIKTSVRKPVAYRELRPNERRQDGFPTHQRPCDTRHLSAQYHRSNQQMALEHRQTSHIAQRRWLRRKDCS